MLGVKYSYCVSTGPNGKNFMAISCTIAVITKPLNQYVKVKWRFIMFSNSSYQQHLLHAKINIRCIHTIWEIYRYESTLKPILAGKLANDCTENTQLIKTTQEIQSNVLNSPFDTLTHKDVSWYFSKIYWNAFLSRKTIYFNLNDWLFEWV